MSAVIEESVVNWKYWTGGAGILSTGYYALSHMGNHPAISMIGRGALIGVAIGSAGMKALQVATDQGPYWDIRAGAAPYAVQKAVEPLCVVMLGVAGGIIGGIAGGALYLAS